MKKRFIAIISLVVVLVAVILAVVIVNNKKEIYVDKDGVEHWIYRNDSGHTVLNEYGDIVIYATDTDGKRQKDENGEYATGAIKFPELMINDNTIETPDYRLEMSKEWKISDNGVCTRKNNENIQLHIVKIGDIGDQNITEFFNKRVDSYHEYFKENPQGSVEPTITTGIAILTAKKLQCNTMEIKQMSEDGSTIEIYQLDLFYENNGEVFNISYVCKNGSYSEDINIVEILHSSLSAKTTK